MAENETVEEIIEETPEASAEEAADDLPSESEVKLESVLEPIVASEDEITPADLPLEKVVETLLFITDRPLTLRQLNRLTKNKDLKKMKQILKDLREAFEQSRAIRVVEVAGGWQMATRKEFSPFVRKLFQDKMTLKLSTPSLETLAIVAYKQPITRAEIEQIRGVEVVAALETLEEKRLVKPVGRKDTVGRPILYGTTQDFLRQFGLGSLEDLPPLDQFVLDLKDPEQQGLPEVEPLDESDESPEEE